MTAPALSALWFLPLALPVSLWIAWTDMKFMKIPNVAVLVLAGGFLVLGPLALPLDAFGMRLLQGLAMLAIGFVASTLRAMGAGDAKFLAAMAPYIAPGDISAALMLFATVLLAAVATHRLARRLPPLRRATPDWQSWTRRDFPMGLALGGTLSIYLLLVALTGS